MAGKDWGDLGQDLNRLIEDAIHVGDFRRLNDNIRGVFDQTFCGMENRKGNGKNGNWEFDLSGNSQPGKAADHQQKAYGGSRQGGARRNESQYGVHSDGTGNVNVSKWKKAPYFAGNGRKYGATAGFMAGGIFLLILSCLPLTMMIIDSMAGNGNGTAMLISFFACLAAGVVLTARGGVLLGLAGRFNRYVKILSGRQYADIKMLAAYSQRSERDVLKDIRKMIRKGWFTQGHLDENETCLMISNESYRQYLDTVRNMKIQQQEREDRERAEKQRRDRLTPEAAAILEKGRGYVAKLKKSNDAIPGEEMSAKIKRMEILVARIFQQAEAHPEKIGDLRRLMDYYLPTTMKLLDAYEELDRQPVQGGHISASKKEIEDTLDTLNQAFEKLLDSLFRDRAWDVSSDISVLETMLAQEGLTENDFGNINV